MKIKAATHMVAGLSLIPAAIVHWNTVYSTGLSGNCALRARRFPTISWLTPPRSVGSISA